MTAIEKPSLPVYQAAASHLNMGDLVAFPTETVYGLGANAYDPEAVEKIFSAKGRPCDNPLIVHIDRMSRLDELIDGAIGQSALSLARKYWPGPLTMIFKKSPRVPSAVSAGLDTVAVRMPAHVVALGLLTVFGKPIAAPSANLSGRPSPTTAKHVYDDLNGWLPLIIDGGECEIGLESTVIDMTSDPPRVLRPGGVTIEMIENVIGEVVADGAILEKPQDGARPISPGTKYRHYAPKGVMTLVTGDADAVAGEIISRYDRAEAEGRRAGILAAQSAAEKYGRRLVFSLGDGAEDAARRLFSALREMDAMGVEEIYAETFERTGMGLAVMNRLLRASGFRRIEV